MLAGGKPKRATPSRCQRCWWCRHGRCSGWSTMYFSPLRWLHNYTWGVLCFGCLITLWRCLASYELGMASCGSSTHESASNVSLFHICFTSPSDTCRVAGWLLCVFVCCFGFLFVCLPCFASARRLFCLTIPPQITDLDDRQCFTARSAKRKKKSALTIPSDCSFYSRFLPLWFLVLWLHQLADQLCSASILFPWWSCFECLLRLAVNLARLTKTRVCLSCFDSTNCRHAAFHQDSDLFKLLRLYKS